MRKYYMRKDTTCQNGIQIIFEPLNPILSSFFRYLKVSKFPFYLSKLVNSSSFGEENAWFNYYEEMDWEDKLNLCNKIGRDINSNELEIHIYDGQKESLVLIKTDFEIIFYNYSRKILENYQYDNLVSEIWKNEMKIYLDKFKSNIDNCNPETKL